jgi:hypothetical protein
VELINSSAAHPQTLGKLERFHKTLKEWLADEGPPEDLAHLQELLDAFRHHYNSERPHQGIGDHTPAERYAGAVSPRELPLNVGFDERGEPVYPPLSVVRKVSSAGKLGYTRKDIWVGKRWAGARVQILPVGDIVHIYWGKELLRAVVLNPDRRYQPMERRVRKAQPVT